MLQALQKTCLTWWQNFVSFDTSATQTTKENPITILIALLVHLREQKALLNLRKPRLPSNASSSIFDNIRFETQEKRLS